MSEQIYTVLLPVAGLTTGTVITYIFGQRKVNQRDDHIEELEEIIKFRDNEIESLNKSLEEHEATLKTLTSQARNTIQDLIEKVKMREERANEANAENTKLRRQNQETMERAKGAEDRIRELQKLRQETNAEITELRRQNQETLERAKGAEDRVNELQKLTEDKEQEISILKAKEVAMQDDFTYLNGIGPKIATTLRSAGIKTFAKLAVKEVDELREILVAENPSLLRLSDPSTWPKQAKMASEGRWENLRVLQEDLRERRRQERLSPQQSPVIETTTFVIET
jgi:predicted flap endonuclease-1-like 5' DNA nuclease